MTRRGSHVTWSTTCWEPRVCIVCGQRVTLKESHFNGGAPYGPTWSIHAKCGGPKLAHELARERA